jgi:hypothetical protein
LPTRIPLSELRRVAALSAVTLIALGLSWQLASVAAAQRAPADVSVRAEPAARGLSASARAGADLSAISAARAGSTGQMVVFALGVPLTVTDGATTVALRVPRGATVNEALDLAGLALGPLDRVSVAVREDGSVASGDVIRVVRVIDSEIVLPEPIAFAVTSVSDPTLPVGRSVVGTAGVAGVAQNTYRVRSAGGLEETRTLVASIELTAPIAEVRRLGTRPLGAAGDMVQIIRDAAARWGADETQLLRVAYCESRYNPNAYNPPSGASGLFQFLATTWAPNSVRAGYAGASVFDPVANANTAAYMFSVGQARQWLCK